MSSSANAKSVRFDADSMWVALSDGRAIGVPIAWFPRLLRATPNQREQVRLSSRGLHWDSLDEDISIAGLLAGLGDSRTDKSFAARSDSIVPMGLRQLWKSKPHAETRG